MPRKITFSRAHVIEQEREYTIKELSDDPTFPWKNRSIRAFIANGELKAKVYNSQKKTITHSEALRFLKEKLKKHS